MSSLPSLLHTLLHSPSQHERHTANQTLTKWREQGNTQVWEECIQIIQQAATAAAVSTTRSGSNSAETTTTTTTTTQIAMFAGTSIRELAITKWENAPGMINQSMSTGKGRGEERRQEGRREREDGKMNTGEIERYNNGYMRKERSIGS